jgi:hypothetical protein
LNRGGIELLEDMSDAEIRALMLLMTKDMPSRMTGTDLAKILGMVALLGTRGDDLACVHILSRAAYVMALGLPKEQQEALGVPGVGVVH